MRAFAAVVSVVLVGAALSPLLRSPTDDGFPLSTFPMFAEARPARVELGYAYGETATGERRDLTPSLVGAGEVLQAMAVVENAIARGKAALEPLCAEIAARVAAKDAYRDVVAIRIVWGTVDASAYLIEHERGTEREQARCALVR